MVERAPIRTLIVDDEPLARRLLGNLLLADRRFAVVGTCDCGEAAIEAVRTQAPDLVFLDIEMPDLSGFEVIERLGTGALRHVVFVTAYDHYAVKAFRVHALDYLLKPIEVRQLRACLDRVLSLSQQQSLSALAERVLAVARGHGADDGAAARPTTRAAEAGTTTLDADAERLTFSHRGHLVSLAARDIVWLEACDQYAKLHTASESYLLSRSLSALVEALPARLFARIHRSAAVNLRFVREIRPARYGSHWIVLAGGQRLRLARARRDLLPRLLSSTSR